MNSASTDLPHHLGILQEHLLHPTNYEKAFGYFLDEFGGDVKFAQMSVPHALPALTPLLERILAKALSKPTKIQQIHLSALTDHRFYHGAGVADGHALMIIFFAELQKGLMAIIPGPNGAMECARFSVIASEVPVDPSVN